MKDEEIRAGRNRLNGDAPSGRLYDGKRDQGGRMVYTEVSADPNARPPSWRVNQATKPVFDFIFSKRIV